MPIPWLPELASLPYATPRCPLCGEGCTPESLFGLEVVLAFPGQAGLASVAPDDGWIDSSRFVFFHRVFRRAPSDGCDARQPIRWTQESVQQSKDAWRLGVMTPQKPAPPALTERTVVIKSAEDILLRKLQWYRLDGETSDRHWNDVLGIVRTQGERLDLPYLRRWAESLEIADLLDRTLGS